MKHITPALKHKAVLVGWIAGITLAASLLWAISFPFRAMRLMHSANRALASIDDPRRLGSPLPDQYSGQAPMGCWYDISEPEDAQDSVFYVFFIMRNGILVPCGVQVSDQGIVVDIVPLGNHAQKAIAHIPGGIIDLYIRRIESAASKVVNER